ncbi:aryl-alcohol-oxidase from pleurotus Eryingii, partial [Mycena floridula]
MVKKVYDFVVVGGGTAGLVLANWLTENPSFSVLVIEAGGSNKDVLNSEVPFFAFRLPNSPYDWNFTTTPQLNLNGRVIGYPRGFLLGGSSSINNMAYTRGSSEDYDRYAALTGDPGWSWNNMLQYFFKNEILTPPADHHDPEGEINPALHGHSGINGVSLPGFPTPLDSRVVETTGQLPLEFPYNEDINSGFQLGIGWKLNTIRGGQRSSSARSYLDPRYNARPNLDVLINTRVTRILPTSTPVNSTSLRLTSVEFLDPTDGSKHVITASKEVLLSAGAIGSPHILQHSGIGDSQKLISIGIDTVFHNPSVGQNLTDHPLVALTLLVNTTETFDNINRNATLTAQFLKQWNETHAGPLVSSFSNHYGWLRLSNDSSIWQQYSDPATGPNTAHYEFLFGNGIHGAVPPTGNFMSISIAVVSPISRGEITWNSSNSLDSPIINPKFFDSPFDLFAMREAIRSARRFVAGPAWSNYVISELPNSANATSDEDLDALIRASAVTIDHVSGTAAMSSVDATYGVVDPDFRVKGIQGLRVVDASVFPKIPAGHTQVPTYVFAERASDLIKAA